MVVLFTMLSVIGTARLIQTRVRATLLLPLTACFSPTEPSKLAF